MPLPKNKRMIEVAEPELMEACEPGAIPAKIKHNREGWLTALAKEVTPVYRGFVLSPYRLTCGWPSKLAMGRRVRRLGECHSDKSSTGGVHELFITPLLDKPMDVAGVVCHELAHVAAGVQAGHKGLYLKVIRQVGLTKNKPTQAMPGPLLEDRLAKLLDKLGPYPHQAMALNLKETREKDKSSVSVICQECGCICRMSVKWIDQSGFPTCGCGGLMELKD